MKRILAPCIVAAALMMAPAAASADTITFTLDTHFGANPAGGDITATLTDVVGGVQLTMDASALPGQEYVKEWYFNLDPTLDPTALTYTPLSGIAASTILDGAQCCQADGDGKFDIQFNFPTDAGSRLGVDGNTSVYLLSLPGLTANRFDFSSVEGGGQGTFFSAAHIGAIGAGAQGSDWVGDGDGPDEDEQVPVPEPGTMLLFGAGVAAFVARRRQRTA